MHQPRYKNYQQHHGHQQRSGGSHAQVHHMAKKAPVMQPKDEDDEEDEDEDEVEDIVLAHIDYKTHDGWKAGKILAVNEDGTYEIRQDNGAIGAKWRSENMRLHQQQKIEYNSVDGWLVGSVITANMDGTYEIKQNNGTVGSQWRSENIRIMDAKKQQALKFLNTINVGQKKSHAGNISIRPAPGAHGKSQQIPYNHQLSGSRPPLPFINTTPTTTIISKVTQPSQHGRRIATSNQIPNKTRALNSQLAALALKTGSNLSPYANVFNPRPARGPTSTSYSTPYPMPTITSQYPPSRLPRRPFHG